MKRKTKKRRNFEHQQPTLEMCSIITILSNEWKCILQWRDVKNSAAHEFQLEIKAKADATEG